MNQLPEPKEVLYRIKRGLAGYVSYLAACEMNSSFSEYILYEPILRILTSQGYIAKCEVPCPRIAHSQTGDRKRLDFTCEKNSVKFSLEVKWAKNSNPKIKEDIKKLKAYKNNSSAAQSFLCIFGKNSCISKIKMGKKIFRERGRIVVADFGKTKYGCRIWELI